MAIDEGSKTVSITTSVRTFAIGIDAPFRGDFVATAKGERITVGPDGAVMGAPDRASVPEVTLSLKDNGKEKFTRNGVTMTLAQLSDFIAYVIDQKRQEMMSPRSARKGDAS